MKLSELTQDQKSHLAWRLDSKTCCGLLTAAAVARGDHGNLDIVEIFIQYGQRTRRSALAHARKVETFVVDENLRIVTNEILRLHRLVLDGVRNLTMQQTADVMKGLAKSLKDNARLYDGSKQLS